ncbi:MAG: hypothetical protein R2722_00035 [Tessaracoccus sp.]
MAGERRPWWSTWPGALGCGIASLLLSGLGTLGLLIYVTLPVDNVGGTDFLPGEGPSLVSTIAAWVGLVALVALPVLTTVWARRVWLGYMLLGLVLSTVGGMAGLVWVGIL